MENRQKPDALSLKQSNAVDTVVRANTLPTRKPLQPPMADLGRRSEDLDNVVKTPFFSESIEDMKGVLTPEVRSANIVHLTAVHTATTPTPSFNTPLQVQEPLNIELTAPNQIRAFSRRAYSFQKRQWFENICCISICPFLMVMTSFILKIVISRLSDGGNADYQILYCSNRTSTNQQNWPIFNITSSTTAQEPNPGAIPYANKKVFSVNFMSRLSLVDLTGRDPISQLVTASVAGSLPCVQWFGAAYPTSGDSVYETTFQPLNTYSNKDSLYSSEILSGWLDVLAATNGVVDPNNAYAQQALALLRSFVVYQARPWYMVAIDPSVDEGIIGSAPQEPSFDDPKNIPGQGILYFKNNKEANGILDSIEPRYYVLATALPPALNGYQKVPYFEKNYSDERALSEAYFTKLSDAVLQLTRVPPVDQSVAAVSKDIAIAQTVFNMQKAVYGVPFTGIHFKKIDNQAKNYSYMMQVGSNSVLSNVQGFPPRGFRAILQQSQLSNGIIRFSNETLGSAVITQGTRAFPYLQEAQIQVPFGSIIGRILYPLGISFLLPIFTLTLVKDKETRIIVMLRMNGLGDVSGYYISNYVLFYLNYLVSTLIFMITGFAVSLELFARTSWGLLIIILLIWGHIQISLAFVFNAMFKSSSIATIGVFILTVCGVVTSFILDQVFQDVASFPAPLYAWPPFVFYRILDILNRHATSTALVPYTMEMVKPGNVIFNSIIILSAQVVILILVAIYLTQVLPTDFGSQRPWNFPYLDLKAYFYGKKKTNFSAAIAEKHLEDEAMEDDDVRQERLRVTNEEYSPDAPLVMHGMRKEYISISGKHKLAVKDVSLCVENNVVFGLLGPNGAGKTSLISILTGVYAPTSGNAKLAGYNIVDEPELAFRSIGVCPQFDILWAELTVEEHLYFYARLKGVSIEFEDAAVNAALDLVSMTEFRTRTVKGLSGGERRRVSIAIALVSNPKVVFLDEPTTGLDPEVRRTVWDTIARARGNRAILMTTHSMEEAEVCCQTIGIMAKGRMRCLGSPTRLKYLYGCGYKLSITFTDAEKAEELISQILPPGYKLLHAFFSSRRYAFVPDADQLANVFDRLVNDAQLFAITNFGISQTTLDEIFTTIVSEEDAES